MAALDDRRENDRRENDRRADAPAAAAYGIDRRGTAERTEMRFLAPRPVVLEAERLARANLTLGDIEADAPWYTTTYCDTRDQRLFRSAERGHGTLLRFREYHPRRPERALASRRVWIEWKDEGPARSKKQRVIVRPSDVAPFLRGEAELLRRIEIAEGSRDMFAGGLSPVVVTQCRRVAYSSRRDDIRITFDHELTYLALDDVRRQDPAPCSLGVILAREPDIVVELKWQHVLPEWLAELLDELRDRSADRHPKFVVAMRHLLSRREQGRDGR